MKKPFARVAWWLGTALAAASPGAAAPTTRAEEAAGRPVTVPAPADVAADVIVSGWTSTAKNLSVVAVGQQIPDTFSEGKVKKQILVDRIEIERGSMRIQGHRALKPETK